jgi:NAD(P)-dependent dehydrogenase (short-subunit alcohol dehydrogenase family)
VCSLGGTNLPEILHRQSLDDIRGALNHDLAPFLYDGRAVLPVMMAGGSGAVINIAADAGKIATPGESVTGAGMAAIVQFTRGLAIEGKRDAIRANTISPSLVEGTPLTERLMQEGTFAAKLFANARPAGRPRRDLAGGYRGALGLPRRPLRGQDHRPGDQRQRWHKRGMIALFLTKFPN